jgi:hypothetical protein
MLMAIILYANNREQFLTLGLCLTDLLASVSLDYLVFDSENLAVALALRLRVTKLSCTACIRRRPLQAYRARYMPREYETGTRRSATAAHPTHYLTFHTALHRCTALPHHTAPP